MFNTAKESANRNRAIEEVRLTFRKNRVIVYMPAEYDGTRVKLSMSSTGDLIIELNDKDGALFHLPHTHSGFASCTVPLSKTNIKRRFDSEQKSYKAFSCADGYFIDNFIYPDKRSKPVVTGVKKKGQHNSVKKKPVNDTEKVLRPETVNVNLLSLRNIVTTLDAYYEEAGVVVELVDGKYVARL